MDFSTVKCIKVPIDGIDRQVYRITDKNGIAVWKKYYLVKYDSNFPIVSQCIIRIIQSNGNIALDIETYAQIGFTYVFPQYDSHVDVSYVDNMSKMMQQKIFVEYNESITGDGTSYQPGDFFTVAQARTFYAIYRYSQIRFDKGASDAIGSMQPIEARMHHKVELPTCTFTRDGYAFSHWSYRFSTYQPDKYFIATDEATIWMLDSNDVTLSAIWNPMYTIYFQPGDHGSGTMAPIQLESHTYVMFMNCTFDQDANYKFDYWSGMMKYHDSDYYFILSEPTDGFYLDGDTILTAIWKGKYTITYLIDNSTNPPTLVTQYYYAKDTFRLMDSPIIIGSTVYNFDKWKDLDYNTQYRPKALYTMPYRDVTLVPWYS